MSIIQERLKEVEAKTLFSGSGPNPDKACIMQMVSYVAGEKWTDHPECACPILTRYAIALNDRFTDAHRQLLKPFIPLLVSTRSDDATQIARKRLLMWRNVTAAFPLVLDAVKLPAIAKKLRTLKNTNEDMAKARELLFKNREKIRNANADAYAYANANANAYAYANAYADAYANADAYAYANANAYAYAYANANADAYAYAYANALRDKLSAVCIETLRMAIDVKPASAGGPSIHAGSGQV